VAAFVNSFFEERVERLFDLAELVERIFASHLEDWPALLKSLRSVGDEVRGEAAPAAVPEKTIE